MKHILIPIAAFGLLAGGSVLADVPARVSDGERGYHSGEKVKAVYELPCDTTEGAALNAGLTPVALQLTPSIKREGTIYNSGTTFVYYRTAQWGLPPDWATIHSRVAPGSAVNVNLSGVQQLWSWSAAAQTPAPSYFGCYAFAAPAYVPTVTKTITPTNTPTATPTITKTITPTFTATFTPTITPTVTPTP